jgi:ABC-type dipeptide/oligopeptide/nickel transport system permease subunit
MKPLSVLTSPRTWAIGFLLMVAAVCLFAEFAAPASYAHQFRDVPDAAPSHQHLLGTDDLGRDRLSRLLYGTRVSLLLAPAAALLSSFLAAVIGGAAGFAGGWVERCVMAATDLFLSLPWLFLLITVRALMPLNVSPITSVAVTFALLGSLGWAAAARVICSDARTLSRSDFILLARASGIGGFRLLWRHILPNLRTVLYAQFWISIPVFILTEANLGILGLGVAEPLPSWGGLLRELESFSAFSAQPWQFAPLVLLVLVVSCFHLAMQEQELSA